MNELINHNRKITLNISVSIIKVIINYFKKEEEGYFTLSWYVTFVFWKQILRLYYCIEFVIILIIIM